MGIIINIGTSNDIGILKNNDFLILNIGLDV